LELLIGAALLFAAWIGWLAYLVAHRPVVIARTEFLVADLVVVGRVDRLDGPVKVQAVCSGDAGKVGQEIPVTNLEHCRADWTGPGDYLLPLLRTDKGYEVANPTGYPEAEQQVPPRSRSPGFYTPPGEPPTPHIYPADPQTEAQVEQIFGRPCRR
jgi:hypothetical protein